MSANLAVCILSEGFFPLVGGGETDARDLARELTSLGAKTVVITRRLSQDLPRQDEVDGVPVFRVSPSFGGRWAKYLMLPAVVGELIKRRKAYDVVCVVNFRVLGLIAAPLMRLLGKPCVMRGGTCGELSGRYADASGVPSNDVPFWVATLLGLRTAVLKQARYFVGISSAIMNEFAFCKVPDNCQRLIACGVKTDLFCPVTKGEQGLLRQQLQLPQDRYLVGYSGKFNRGKGLKFLVRALAESLKIYPDLHLVLIGSGGGQFLSEEEDLKVLAQELGVSERITMTGYVQNVHAYVQCLDMFCLPTEYEALSISVLEAMACGLPVVASRVGGVPDLVDDGETGFLVEPANPELISEAIHKIRKDETIARRFSVNGRKKAERFSLTSIAQQHLNLFLELVSPDLEVKHA